jgi:methionine sulfoxide reductase heme-binding subunit
MESIKVPPLSGWWLTGWIMLALIGMTVMAALGVPEPAEAARLVVRLTARTSLLLFAMAFTASSLARLLPSPATRWQRRNRRYLAVGFAGSHLIHALAIIALARLDPGLFLELTNPVSYVAGGLAYVFIILMTVTSFDRTAAMIGPRAWKWLHTVGAWYIWMSFALNFGKRFAVNPAYWPAMGVVALVLLLRLLAASRAPVRLVSRGAPEATRRATPPLEPISSTPTETT